jgi:hypothetical protein
MTILNMIHLSEENAKCYELNLVRRTILICLDSITIIPYDVSVVSLRGKKLNVISEVQFQVTFIK